MLKKSHEGTETNNKCHPKPPLSQVESESNIWFTFICFVLYICVLDTMIKNHHHY